MKVATPEQVKDIQEKARALYLSASAVARQLGLSLPRKMNNEPEMDLEDLSKPSGHTYVATINKEHLWQWMQFHDKSNVDEIRQGFWSGHGHDGSGLGIAMEVELVKRSVEDNIACTADCNVISKAWGVWRNDNLHDLIADCWDSDNGQVDGTMKISGYLTSLLKGQ